MTTKKPIKVKVGGHYMHDGFGPLYINGKFRDGGGTCYMGINGVDGVSYQDYSHGFTKELTREEFDAAVAPVRAAAVAKVKAMVQAVAAHEHDAKEGVDDIYWNEKRRCVKPDLYAEYCQVRDDLIRFGAAVLYGGTKGHGFWIGGVMKKFDGDTLNPHFWSMREARQLMRGELAVEKKSDAE